MPSGRRSIGTAALGLSLIAIAVLLTVYSRSAISAKHDLERALRFERQNRPGAALAIYRRLLPVVARNPRVASQLHMRIGECLWRLQRPSDAFEAYDKALQADSHNVNAETRVAELYLASGSPEEAILHANAVLGHDAKQTDAWAVLGSAFSTTGRLSLAEEAYERVLSVEPGRVQVAVALAELYNHENRVADARRVLITAAATQRSSATPWLALGRLEEQQGQQLAAEHAYQSAVHAENSAEANLRLAQFLEREGRVNEAQDILKQVDAMPTSSRTARGDFEFTSGHADEAVASYRAAITASDGKQQAIVRLIEAEMQSDSVDGIAHARNSLKEYRNELDAPTIALLQAELDVHEGQLSEAAEKASDTLTVSPDSAAAHYVLGVAKYLSGDRATARAEWAEALQQDANFVPAQVAMAQVALNSGRFKEAEEQAAAVVRQEPGNIAALVTYARALAAQNQTDSAVSIARRAIAINAVAPEPHLVMGDIALHRGQFARALVEFEQAVLLQPHSREGMDGLVRTYRVGKITRPMLARMERTANHAPRSATLLEIAGRLYADHGWNEDAQRCLRAALDIDSGRSTAALALAQSYLATGNVEAALAAAGRGDGIVSDLIEGAAAEQRGDVQAAAVHYQTALRRGDRSGVAANNLAWIYTQQSGNLQAALELATSAHQQDPENPAIVDTLGIVQLKRREYSEAVKTLELASGLAQRTSAPDEVAGTIREHLAQAYALAGQSQSAQNVLVSKLRRTVVAGAGGQ
jgi:tetratricopeptide (TPR) repeat protein